jgi:hypothetical protein
MQEFNTCYELYLIKHICWLIFDCKNMHGMNNTKLLYHFIYSVPFGHPNLPQIVYNEDTTEQSILHVYLSNKLTTLSMIWLKLSSPVIDTGP